MRDFVIKLQKTLEMIDFVDVELTRRFCSLKKVCEHFSCDTSLDE